MIPAEFLQIRKALEKTQKEIARLLGVSLKAVHSYEQGWRFIPAYIERQMLFLVLCKIRGWQTGKQCWTIKKCPVALKKKCPAWELHCGRLCWFVNGTLCEGRARKNWTEKMRVCRGCEVLADIFQLSPLNFPVKPANTHE